MYERFFDLREMPFELTPDPRYLYLSRQHREALSNLEYGLLSAKGITVLIGEAGTGKTTLLHAMLASNRCRHVSSVFVNNPTLTRTEFVETLSERFHLGPQAAHSKAAFLTELDTLLRERRTAGCITALVIDEAQSLTAELLEEIRLLANSETSTQKLLPLVLVGQPELRDRLNETGLRQLKQRVTLRCEITPFALPETTDYIVTRLRAAGGDPVKLFTRDAVTLIHERSGGIPRTISVLCDNALLTAYAIAQQPVTRAIVEEVAADFDLADTAAMSESPSEATITYRPTRPERPADVVPIETVARRADPPEAGVAPDESGASRPGDSGWWHNVKGTWQRWTGGAKPSTGPMRPTPLMDPRYYAADVPIRGRHDESR